MQAAASLGVAPVAAARHQRVAGAVQRFGLQTRVSYANTQVFYKKVMKDEDLKRFFENIPMERQKKKQVRARCGPRCGACACSRTGAFGCTGARIRAAHVVRTEHMSAPACARRSCS